MNQTLFTVILLILHIVFVYNTHSAGKSFYDDRQEKGKTNPKIYDIAHKYLPNLSHVKNLEFVMNIILFLPLIAEYDMFEEFLERSLPITMFRYITTNVTILPKTKHCDDSRFGFFSIFNGHCYDKMFSGHYAMCTIMSLMMIDRKYNSYFVGFYNVFIMVMLLASRGHYSIDIVLGGYVALSSYLLNIRFSN